jgi:hypothetical protein
MKLYKYRTAGDYFKRDLDSITENIIYAPNAEKLNDPCETLVFSDKVQNQTKLFSKIFDKKSQKSVDQLHEAIDNFVSGRKDIGIYSLSKRYDNELMWAHYANNHEGFCIEYDFETLMNKNKFCNFYSFEVKYTNKPPQIDIQDISSGKNNNLLKKIAGTKSKRWSYEKEIRIIADKFGEQDYDYSALKAIYFGYRMPTSSQNKIMKRLAGRNLQYYQIHLDERSYKFTRHKVADKYENSKKYLFEIYRDEELNNIVKYSVINIVYHQPDNKGELSIQLDSKITKTELADLGRQLKEKLFRKAERIYIFYYLKSDILNNYAWGLTHYDSEKETIEICGITIDKKDEFSEIARNDKRLVIGH